MHTPPTSRSTSQRPLLQSSPAVGISSRACRALISARIEAPSLVPATRSTSTIDKAVPTPPRACEARAIAFSPRVALPPGACPHLRRCSETRRGAGVRARSLRLAGGGEGGRARQTQRVPGRGPRAIPKAGSALKKKGSLLLWQLAFRRSWAPHRLRCSSEEGHRAPALHG